VVRKVLTLVNSNRSDHFICQQLLQPWCEAGPARLLDCPSTPYPMWLPQRRPKRAGRREGYARCIHGRWSARSKRRRTRRYRR